MAGGPRREISRRRGTAPARRSRAEVRHRRRQRRQGETPGRNFRQGLHAVDSRRLRRLRPGQLRPRLPLHRNGRTRGRVRRFRRQHACLSLVGGRVAGLAEGRRRARRRGARRLQAAHAALPHALRIDTDLRAHGVPLMPRLQGIRNAALAACVGACCAMADTPVENVDHFGRLPGQTVEILPGELFDEFHAERARPVLGYKDGETWRALVCAEECRLEWVKIRTHATTVQPYDGEPIAGETMTLDHRPDGTLIALFRDLPGKPQAKPPTTLHAGMQQYPAARSPGSMEIDIPRNGEPPLRVTPRLPRDDPGALNIWLEGGPQRQLLGAVPLDGIVGFA